MEFPQVSPRVFNALQNVDVSQLSNCSPSELRPILPCLVRMSLLSSFDSTPECAEARREILRTLTGIEHVNSIVALLSIDFHALEVDVKREQQLRQKHGSQYENPQLVYSNGLAHHFERSDHFQRIRYVVSELLNISAQIQDHKETPFKQSDLFDNVVYLEEVCDVLCIALAELPALLLIHEIAEILLHLQYGPEMTCWLIANAPHHFRHVCTCLISNGDRQDEDSILGRQRNKTLRMLCQMNPLQSLLIRGKCVDLCRMPGLTIQLSLDQPGDSDTVGFISGLLMGNDPNVKSWFSIFIRNGQKRKGDANWALQMLRNELLRQLINITVQSREGILNDDIVVTSSAFIKLYCALKVAGIKFTEDEVAHLIDLLTCKPPANSGGVHFASLALCMLIACPSLIALVEHEKRAVQWVQWLVKYHENYFDSVSGAGFGEMLLLMAIHFHSNQLNAITELVNSTLGNKIQNRSNNMTRLKQIFTQDIFTEQVVAAHAVKVPVTPGLNANMQGFLPIHCIHQLLKSRAFAKHKVPIHIWIYKQMCASEAPIHSILPPLIEAYVNSILVPPGTKNYDASHTNKPLSEQQIRAVFQNSVFGRGLDSKLHPIESLDTKPSLASQLLLLYYILLYEDTRLTNSVAFATSGNHIRVYSSEFMSELPIKYLLKQAQRDRASYSCLFSSLLKLLATHFPHLSLVEDWLDDDSLSISRPSSSISAEEIESSLNELTTCPARASKLLQKLLTSPATDIWRFAELIISYFSVILDDRVPQQIQELYKEVWLKLNTVLPRSLWVMTINALLPEESRAGNLTQENIFVDPLQALRVDPRVFRCAAALTVTLRVLQASLAASRNHLARHMLNDPLVERTGQLTCEAEREELRLALISTQESLSVQILLEFCLEKEEDRVKPGQQLALREVRSLICSYLHQVFISDPGLVKLVHFQGYPRELLPITVQGIPSMHICLDFIPELLSQPSLEKQIFAVDLTSYLSVQYAVPKSLSVARLALNTLSTLLTVLPSYTRSNLFRPVLPCLVRICEAFPPLSEDTISFLMQLGKVSAAQAALDAHDDDSSLCDEVHVVFRKILQAAVLAPCVY